MRQGFDASVDLIRVVPLLVVALLVAACGGTDLPVTGEGSAVDAAGAGAGPAAAAGAAASDDAADAAELEATVALAGLDAPRGLRVATDGSAEGYVLFSPIISDTTYLIDRDGRVVHTWTSRYSPGGGAYLLENGHLLRGARIPDAAVFRGGGQGGRLEEFTWDGDLVWDYVFASDRHLLHHDIEVLPNGNVLAIAWESKSAEEARQAGRRPELIPEGGMWPDMIVELEPRRPDGARIVWEWHVWDHLVQDHDPEARNYGDPAEHPELIDINGDAERPEISPEELEQLKALGYVPPDTTPEDVGSDWLHTNAIDYNAELDQIVVSTPRFNEIWVIDHSTATAEAASHSGGRWGRGGDLLYRWGNPRAYGRGDESQQQLFAQHDVRWVEEGLPGAGHLTVFSNEVPGPEGPHSAVLEIVPPLGPQGYLLSEGAPYGPAEPVWSYTAPDGVSFFSPFISGAHRLANGHTLITSGAQGRFFEVTPAGDIVWEYWTPYSGEVRLPDGSLPQPVGPFGYAVFRATKVPADHPALRGRRLAPLSPQPAPIAAPPPPPPGAGRGRGR